MALGDPVAMLAGHTSRVLGVCSVEVNGRVLVASASRDQTVRLWDPVTGQSMVTLTGHTAEVWGICSVEVGGRVLVASASGDRSVRLWEVGDTEHRRTGETEARSTGRSTGPRRVFISYRRRDTEADAGRLHADLTTRFGEDRLFMDVDNVPLGANVQHKISDAISQSAALLAVVGPDWQPSEWIQIELETAFKMGVPVIPVCVRRAEMPRRRDLPETLQDFAVLNAAEIEHQSWRRDLEPILNALQQLLPE